MTLLLCRTWRVCITALGCFSLVRRIRSPPLPRRGDELARSSCVLLRLYSDDAKYVRLNTARFSTHQVVIDLLFIRTGSSDG